MLQPQWAKYNEKPKNCIVGDIFLQLFNRYCTIYVEKQDLLNIIDKVSLPSCIMKIINIFLTPMLPDDREPVMDTFNYYIKNSYAAYPEQTLSCEFLDCPAHFHKKHGFVDAGTLKRSTGKTVKYLI